MPKNAKRRLFSSISVATLILALLVVFVVECATASWVRGVQEAQQSIYTPKGETWTCLDGSKSIPSSAINDDYCDCADGSDEPGTSACPNGFFYCHNLGHISARIPSSRVDDGICDPECCDGSDEATLMITCPNICSQVGKEHRRQMTIIRAIQAKGAAKKRELIAGGKKLKAQWLTEKEEIDGKIEGMRAEVVKLRKTRDELEVRNNAVREEAKIRVGYVPPTPTPTPTPDSSTQSANCPTCPSCSSSSSSNVNCVDKATSARATLQTLLAHTDNLVSIMRALKNDHNPNYNDMAVKHAITAYDDFLKVWEGEESNNDGYREDVKIVIDEDLSDENLKDDKYANDIDDDGEYDDEASSTTETDVKESESQSEEEALKNDAEYQQAKGALAHASDSLLEAESAVNNAEKRLADVTSKLETDYGQDGEWAQLDGTCLERNEAEYKYKVCFFGGAEQISSRDNYGTSLGSFSRWDGPGAEGTASWYTKQVYKNGQKCWNGPERSVHLTLECGEDNEILTVTEPEKCEYAFHVRSPAVCSLDFNDVNDVNDGTATHKELSHEEL